MDHVEVLHLEPSECLYVADSLEEVASQRSHFEGCDICNRYKGDDSNLEKLQHHIKSYHCNLAASRELSDGRKVYSLPCRKGCMVRGGANSKRSHYHCPFCSRMCGRRNNMVNHFKIRCNELKWKSSSHRQPPTFIGRKMAVSDIDMSLSQPMVECEEDTQPMMQDHVITVMEMRLSEWIQDQRLFGRTVNVSKMLVQAKSLYEKTKSDLGLTKVKSFHAGKQWIKSFLARFGMKDSMVVSVEGPDQLKPPEKDVIIRVIEKVALKPVLYDPLVAALEDHNEENEEALWSEIAEAVGLESGTVAKQIWRNVEKKYCERTRPGANPTEPWDYEHYMKFLPTEIVLEDADIAGEAVVETSNSHDVTSPSGKRMVTVSIHGDDLGAGDEYYTDSGAGDRRVAVAKLKKIQLQMDMMQQEHEVKMQLLHIEKTILMKKLDGIR